MLWHEMTCDKLSEKRQDVKKNVKSGNPFVLWIAEKMPLGYVGSWGWEKGRKQIFFILFYTIHFLFSIL